MTDPYIGINATKIDFFDNEVGAVKSLKVLDDAVKLTGNQTVAGIKTFSNIPVLPAGTAALNSKVITITRDLTAASGDVNYTGVGWVPTSISFEAQLPNTLARSSGFADSAKGGVGLYWISATASGCINVDVVANGVILIASSSGNQQYAIVKTYNADGWTLTFTKAGSPTGIATIICKCYR